MGRGLPKIGSDQATEPEGLDVVRAYGVYCCALLP
jgi:hypothetical protein